MNHALLYTAAFIWTYVAVASAPTLALATPAAYVTVPAQAQPYNNVAPDKPKKNDNDNELQNCIRIGDREFCSPIGLENFKGFSKAFEEGKVPDFAKQGLAKGRAVVMGKVYRDSITLDAPKGIQIANLAIQNSSTNQVIQEILWNDGHALIIFDKEGNVALTVHSLTKPVRVFADRNELEEFKGAYNTSDPNEIPKGTWVYYEPSRTVVVNVDPASITLDFVQPIQWGLIIGGIVALGAAILVVKKFKR